MDGNLMLDCWKEYLNKGKIDPCVSPLVGNSWSRCKAKVNPYHVIKFNKLGYDHLLSTQVASFDLISVARPIMEDIFQDIDHQEIAIILLNSAGYVLDILATPIIEERMKAVGFSTGVICTEEHIGTNAFGLALTARMPVQIIGAEHYCQQFHQLAGSAAPIFDLTGRPLGILGIISTLSNYNKIFLGLMVAGAKAVEAQLQADFLLAENNNQLAQLHTILNTISEGIIVWSGDLDLIHFNDSASKILDTTLQSLVGVNLVEFMTYPDFILKAIEKREPLTDVEATINIGDRELNLVLSFRYIQIKDTLLWIISTFRPVKEVRRLVQDQVGAHASFTMEDILGESPPIKKIRRLGTTAAAATASILIRGESGTGKNILASAIHNQRYYKEDPFLIFPSSSITHELVVSELVGYVEGRSGLHGSRPSKFELAQGGTLYFKDVDALPLEAQAILLNYLELKVVQRLGSDRPIELDVRIIASTSANMERLIATRHFRADLYYRLGTFTIFLPPLRERKQDIPLYVDRILARLSRQLNCSLSCEQGVMEALCRYPWPGNIRELESVLGPAAVQAVPSGVIKIKNLPESIQRPSFLIEENQELVPIKKLEEVEREAIEKTAQVWKGNLTDMAQNLGIGRTTLWRKIKKYNILLDDN
jgi:transcriptional regulator of acetoin/glycerol metabolism